MSSGSARGRIAEGTRAPDMPGVRLGQNHQRTTRPRRNGSDVTEGLMLGRSARPDRKHMKTRRSGERRVLAGDPSENAPGRMKAADPSRFREATFANQIRHFRSPGAILLPFSAACPYPPPPPHRHIAEIPGRGRALRRAHGCLSARRSLLR